MTLQVPEPVSCILLKYGRLRSIIILSSSLPTSKRNGTAVIVCGLTVTEPVIFVISIFVVSALSITGEGVADRVTGVAATTGLNSGVSATNVKLVPVKKKYVWNVSAGATSNIDPSGLLIASVCNVSFLYVGINYSPMILYGSYMDVFDALFESDNTFDETFTQKSIFIFHFENF